MYFAREVLITLWMRANSAWGPSSFHASFDALIARPLLEDICSDCGPARRRPPKLELPALIQSMVFHCLQGAGTLARNVKYCVGTVLSDSALAQRRAALGFEPFYWILQAALGPKARPTAHPQAFYKHKRLVALDGSRFSVSNTPQVSGVMFKAVSRRFRAAFAKVGVCVLVELGLRNPLAASIGIKHESEMALAQPLLEQIPEDALTLGDRHYGVRPVIARMFELGRDFLFRVKSNFKRRLVEHHPDGSALVEIETPTGRRRVREVMGQVRRPGGHWATVRLWTSLLDWKTYPAAELLELYGRRWEEEIFYRELKVDLRRQPLLQSHTPETAAQEVAALLLAQAILVDQRMEAARQGKVEVLRISFRQTLRLLQPLWLLLGCSQGILTPDQIRQMVRRVMAELAATALGPRRQRSCPRAVRQPVSSWPRLLTNTCQTGPTEFEVMPITR